MNVERGPTDFSRCRDLKVLDCLQASRVQFFDLLARRSVRRDEELLAALNAEAIYVIAEFYYRLDALKIETADDVERFAMEHNQRLSRLDAMQPAAGRPIPKPERIQRAQFSTDVMLRLVQNWRDHKGAIDQSNLARFLVLEMSTETCRKAVVALAKAGCLDRMHTPYGTTLVLSNGCLEEVFGTALRTLYTCMDVARS
ncbi:hypothetical protein ACI7BZ_06190 [Xanthobacter sp. AM11]|uniref:hypothetical protein n=1 Tax=Xanthobacter sp. AM11 TaxID=3380643 RepID=UPI0039BFE1F1